MQSILLDALINDRKQAAGETMCGWDSLPHNNLEETILGNETKVRACVSTPRVLLCK